MMQTQDHPHYYQHLSSISESMQIKNSFYTLGIYTLTHVYYVHVGVWGELAGHQRSLTHHPSSQGWAFRCPVIVCLFVNLCRYVTMFRTWVGVSFFLLFLVCYAHSV